MNDFLIGIAIGLGTAFVLNTLNSQYFTTTTAGAPPLNGNPVCSLVQSNGGLPILGIGIAGGYLLGGTAGAFGAAAGAGALVLIGLKGIN